MSNQLEFMFNLPALNADQQLAAELLEQLRWCLPQVKPPADFSGYVPNERIEWETRLMEAQHAAERAARLLGK